MTCLVALIKYTNKNPLRKGFIDDISFLGILESQAHRMTLPTLR